jgi:hypothetical protein
MNAEPYVRPSLGATRDGVPDPATEVGAWLEQLDDLLAGRTPQGGAHDAYDLLAATARLRRCRPALLAELGASPLLDRAGEALAAVGPDLARRALTVPNPDAWLAEARALDDAWDDVDDPAGRTACAARLVADLDDADLVCVTAARLGEDDAELARALDGCDRWLADHADAFFHASVWVQAVGLALRPDLPEFDVVLARTAEKYVVLLDAFIAAEEELAFAGQPPLPPGVARLLRLGGVADHGPAVLHFPNWLNITRAKAGAAARQAPPAGLRLRRWSAPGGAFFAELVLPGPVTDPARTPLRLFFSDSAGESARALARQPVRLASVPGVIDDEGRVLFTLQDFAGAPDERRLEVGDPPQFWREEPDETTP